MYIYIIFISLSLYIYIYIYMCGGCSGCPFAFLRALAPLAPTGTIRHRINN